MYPKNNNYVNVSLLASNTAVASRKALFKVFKNGKLFKACQ